MPRGEVWRIQKYNCFRRSECGIQWVSGTVNGGEHREASAKLRRERGARRLKSLCREAEVVWKDNAVKLRSQWLMPSGSVLMSDHASRRTSGGRNSWWRRVHLKTAPLIVILGCIPVIATEAILSALSTYIKYNSLNCTSWSTYELIGAREVTWRWHLTWQEKMKVHFTRVI